MNVERLKYLALRGDEDAAKALGPIARRMGDDSLLMWRARCHNEAYIPWAPYLAESARVAYHRARDFTVAVADKRIVMERRTPDGWREVGVTDRRPCEDPLIRRHIERHRSHGGALNVQGAVLEHGFTLSMLDRIYAYIMNDLNTGRVAAQTVRTIELPRPKQVAPFYAQQIERRRRRGR